MAYKDYGTPHRGQSESMPQALELDKNDSEPGIKPDSELIAKEDADSKQNTSTRDNFTDRVKIIMSYRVGGLCSMCGCATYGPASDNDKYYTIGEAAHIVSASAKGPRHDSSMTSDQISDISNGIWLCSNCHTKIDSDEKAYSVEYLKRLREVAETRVTLNLSLAQESLELNTVVSKLVEYDIQQCTDSMEFEELVAKLDYINFKDGYQPFVAEELLRFIEKNINYLASHPASSSVMIMHLKSIIDCYRNDNETLSEKAFKLEKQIKKLMKNYKLVTEELSHSLSNVHLDT